VSKIVVADRCGRIRWEVPATTTFPLAVTFGDDLIVEDSKMEGGIIATALRRFSADGTLIAGPVAVETVASGVVGSDDTIYFVTCPDQQAFLVARDASFAPLWTLDLGPGVCPEEFVLGPGGIFYFTRQSPTSSELGAAQTTSAGPAPGWSRWDHNAAGNRWLDR
jgi:outer membrane protein assembly factor BamB